MTWFKVDDKLAFHPKVIGAGNAAIGLWVRAGAWSADQLTDGQIPKPMIAVLGGRPADARALVDAGLWTDEGDRYQMHDWRDYQPSKADKQENKARGTLGAHRRWHSKHPSPDCTHCTGEIRQTR